VKCRLVEQGYKMGDCLVELPSREKQRACEATLRQEDDTFHRVIEAAQNITSLSISPVVTTTVKNVTPGSSRNWSRESGIQLIR
jgi:hypothetical protein